MCIKLHSEFPRQSSNTTKRTGIDDKGGSVAEVLEILDSGNRVGDAVYDGTAIYHGDSMVQRELKKFTGKAQNN